MPKRAVAAIVTTALALVLLFSFKTPADTASALGAPAGLGCARLPRPAGQQPARAHATPPPVAGETRPPGATPAPTKAATKGSGTFTGSAVQNPFGEVQVQITLSAARSPT